MSQRQEQRSIGPVGIADDMGGVESQFLDECREIARVQSGGVIGLIAFTWIGVVIPPAVGYGTVLLCEGIQLQLPAAVIAEGAVYQDEGVLFLFYIFGWGVVELDGWMKMKKIIKRNGAGCCESAYWKEKIEWRRPTRKESPL